MRPGTGIGANFMGSIIGKRVNKDIEELHQLQWGDLEDY
jgi:sialic acid synthase SpsE